MSKYGDELQGMIVGFENENCDECGKDIDEHVIVPLVGNPFAMCMTRPVNPPQVDLIRIPCEDGAEYDLYVLPPKDKTVAEALVFIEAALEDYFGSNGEKELIPALEKAGFAFPNIYKTEGYW